MRPFIPWDNLAEGCWQGFSADTGHSVEDAGGMTGAVSIKHQGTVSESKTVQQNPYIPGKNSTIKSTA